MGRHHVHNTSGMAKYLNNIRDIKTNTKTRIQIKSLSTKLKDKIPVDP